jgi:tetratricopeptide (TPR) repeat protein
MFLRSFLAVLFFLVLNCTSLHAQSSVPELNEAGWKLIESGEAASAERLFVQALVLRPDEPVLLLGAGVAAHLQDHESEAKAKLRRALEVNPRVTPASQLLGEILYREGDLGQAIKIYETALTLAPANRGLTARLQKWRQEAEVHNTFTERQQGRFSVMFEGRTDTPLAAHTMEVLDAAFSRISQSLRAQPSAPIVVILYTDKQFRDITRAPEWSGGLYDGRIRIPVAGARQSPALFERVLVHELTHAMIASIAAHGVPTWMHEGLAQHFSGDDAPAAWRRLQAHGHRIPLDELEGGFTGLPAGVAAVAYDESLVAVDAMVRRRNVNWAQILYALADSDTPSDALRALGITYPDLEAAFSR